jgi:hypothetical protein
MSWFEVNAKIEGWTLANVPQKTEAPTAEEFEEALARDEERLEKRRQAKESQGG